MKIKPSEQFALDSVKDKIRMGSVTRVEELPKRGDADECWRVGNNPTDAKMYEWCPRRDRWVPWEEWGWS